MSHIELRSNDTRRLQVMIIEDERIVAEDIAAAVEAGGGKIVAYAATAREAVDVAQRTEIDLLLSDVHLADNSNGIDASTRIQACCDVLVAFVTGDADCETMTRMRRLNPLAIIHKPVCEADILTVLDQVHATISAAHEPTVDSTHASHRRAEIS